MFPIVLIKWKKKTTSKVSFINCIQDPWTAPWPQALAGAILHDKSVVLSPTLTRPTVYTVITALEGPPIKTTSLNTSPPAAPAKGNIHSKYTAWKIKSLQTISSRNLSIAKDKLNPLTSQCCQMLTLLQSTCKSVSVPAEMVFGKTKYFRVRKQLAFYRHKNISMPWISSETLSCYVFPLQEEAVWWLVPSSMIFMLCFQCICFKISQKLGVESNWPYKNSVHSAFKSQLCFSHTLMLKHL